MVSETVHTTDSEKFGHFSTTLRIVRTVASFTILSKILSHFCRVYSRFLRKYYAITLSTICQAFSKWIAIPLGLIVITAGTPLASLGICVTGITLLPVVYMADIGSWNEAYRLTVLFLWILSVYAVERWHTDPRGSSRVFLGDDKYH